MSTNSLNSKNLAKWVKGIAVVVSLWTLIIHLPYALSISICAFIPIIAIIIVKKSQGAIHILQLAKSDNSHVIFAIISPSTVLALRALLDYNIYSGEHLILPMLTVCISYILLLYRFDSCRQRTIINYLLILPFVLLYGFGVVMEVNGILDKSTPQIYTVKVIDKYTSGGGYRSLKSHHLIVSPWGKNTTENRVSVPKHIYEKAKKEESLDIAVKQGSLDIPWYGVRIHKRG
jgi:hypothetical protein